MIMMNSLVGTMMRVPRPVGTAWYEVTVLTTPTTTLNIVSHSQIAATINLDTTDQGSQKYSLRNFKTLE